MYRNRKNIEFGREETVEKDLELRERTGAFQETYKKI
jgi:hypothetical protein